MKWVKASQHKIHQKKESLSLIYAKYLEKASEIKQSEIRPKNFDIDFCVFFERQ